MSQRTPGPWRVKAIEQTDRHGPYTQYLVRNEEKNILVAEIFLVNESGKANADFIVRACNSHDALLAALKAVYPMMVPGMNWTDETGQLIKSMVADAIEKAERV